MLRAKDKVEEAKDFVTGRYVWVGGNERMPLTQNNGANGCDETIVEDASVVGDQEE